MVRNPHYIINYSEINKVDEELVGKKAHELGGLWKLGIPLPDGFVITINFYKEFLRLAEIEKKIYKTSAHKHPALSNTVDHLFRKEIIQTPIPQALASELHTYYKHLSGLFKNRPLNIYSSSANGKFISFSNIKGDANLILKIKGIWSMFLDKPVAIVIQENLKSEIKGKISTGNPVVNIKLTEEQMNKLIKYCKIIQKYFYFPKEIEYVVRNNKVIITKVNALTGTISESPKPLIQNNKTRKVLARGISINPGIVTGRVKVFRNNDNSIEIKRGEIIALSHLDHSMFKKIKNAKAIVIDSVLQNSYEKFLYRKGFQIPTIEGVKNATHLFQNGNVITVNGVSGEIYSGGLI